VLLMCEWKLRPHMTRDDLRPLMDVFAKRGLLPGTICWYAKADNSGGFFVIEGDDIGMLNENLLAYNEWGTWSVTPVMTAEQAVPGIEAFLGTAN
jgi:hypothetical protein